ncbi:Ig-like domain-containing protein [Kineococcus rhizosphaerae]|uniref:Glucose/arabinose dehydrogenase n=1 Tax=Kineococcus rhizosphaerae TaxID=559628 RepID=A0A2T0R127_9ACTN|nr:Ig-like domain-containing protein [Kineococcus rhizosphaerae]PRY12979.1 glucose/arabinose dehydrogenase [Kineococcus rhizosphaerae]
MGAYRRTGRALTVLGAALAASGLVGASAITAATTAAAAPPTTAQIDFAPASSPAVAGWTTDTGLGFDATRGYGWVRFADETPVDLSAETRQRTGTSPENSFIHLQRPSGSGLVVAGGRWEYSVPDGVYSVTVGVGDTGKTATGAYCCLDSTHRVSVEGVEAVKDFVPTAAQPTASATVVVAVDDGRLTVDATGGVNTKLTSLTLEPSTATPAVPAPRITSTLPADGATGVRLDTSVSLAITEPVDDTTTAASVHLVGPDGDVPLTLNSDAAGGTISFTPARNLSANTKYTVRTTTALRTKDGQAFLSYSSAFRTDNSSPPVSPYAFRRAATTSVAKPSVMALGPDGRLYVGTYTGSLVRYARAADGTLSAPETVQPFGDRIITGLAFDPADPTALYVTNNYGIAEDAPRSSGAVSLLRLKSGGALSAATASPVIIGLPRSRYDHMTNGLAFGPDGRLYIAQGANTAYGDTDVYWGDRGEQPMSAAILVADVHDTTLFRPGVAVNVNTDTSDPAPADGSAPAVGYRPGAAGAPVKVYASGVRNPYTLVWASNGKLYAPVNESADGGNTPASPDGASPHLEDVPAYADFFTRIVAGKYYGHPNPSTGHYALNGANPTSGVDPWEVRQYPVGTRPEADWQSPDLNLGVHRSPNGAAEYRSTGAFGGKLRGSFIVSEYSNGDDLLAVSLDSAGKPVSSATIADADAPGQRLVFTNPLGVVTDPVSGVVYVAEYLNETDLTSGAITLLKPAQPASTSLKVSFQPKTATLADGYSRDAGAPFDGTRGWQDLAGNPLDLSANTRVRTSSAAPDVRYTSFILVQAPAGSGNTTPGRWVTTLPDGTYDVTVVVGDATATNSRHRIVAQGGTSSEKVVVDGFVPTSSTPWRKSTARVAVTNGRLTLDATGGTNTKLDFVDVVPASGFGGASVDFTTQTGPLAADSVRDYGQAYDTTRGYGWVGETSRQPLSLVGNGRVRGSASSPDQRSDTLILSQATAQTRGTWEYALPNGTYTVTVGVGDATAFNSTYAVTAERGQPGQVTVLAPTTPTSTTRFFTASARVVVADGRLTLDGIGGTNGKLGWVDIAAGG